MRTPTDNTGDAAGDTYTTIENLTGSAFADTLIAANGANTLDGGAGNDVLIGGAGADALIGGTGTDTASYATQRPPSRRTLRRRRATPATPPATPIRASKI